MFLAEQSHLRLIRSLIVLMTTEAEIGRFVTFHCLIKKILGHVKGLELTKEAATYFLIINSLLEGILRVCLLSVHSKLYCKYKHIHTDIGVEKK
jgi:hypothetical protein